jgi:hypothetical protein
VPITTLKRASSYLVLCEIVGLSLWVKGGTSKNTDFGIAIGNTARTAAWMDVGLPDISFEQLRPFALMQPLPQWQSNFWWL